MLLEGGMLGLGTLGLFFASLMLVLYRSLNKISLVSSRSRRHLLLFLLFQYLAINLTLTCYAGATNMILFSCLGLGMAHSRLEDEGIVI
jgi:hypothetical protein